MNIFLKRPLALILCIWVGGFALSAFSSVVIRVILTAICLSLLIITFIKPNLKHKRIIQISLVGIILSVIFTFVYFDLWFKANNRYEGNLKITATVEEYEPITSYTTLFTLKCDNVDNTFASGYEFIAYMPSENTLDLTPGTVINFTADVTGFSTPSSEKNYFSKGVSGTLENINDLEIIGHKKIHLPSFLQKTRENISRYITLLSDSESGGLLSALIVGERDKLSPKTRLDFKRIGITHVLALSGMHLAILSLGLDKLLSLCQIKKKTRIYITSGFIFLYMFLTGFPVSVKRAGIMLLLSSALFLISKTKDSFTSLSVAVFLICLITPYSVYDIALWLSALATFGLILLGDYCSTREKLKTVPEKILSYFTIGILSSLFAISSTLLISQIAFGAVSILGIVSTMIFSLLIEAIMYLGCITLILGPFIPIGKLLPPLCKFTTDLAAVMASPDFVYVKNDSYFAIFFTIFLTLLFFGFAIFKINRKKLYLSILTIVFVVCHIIPIMSHQKTKYTSELNYYSATKCDDFLIISETESCYISSAQYSKNLGYHTLDVLNKENITSLDSLFLTHYSYSIEDELNIILSNVKVQNIYIPKPQTEEEDGILKKLNAFTDKYRAKIILLGKNNSFSVGKYSVRALYTAPYGESSMNAFSISSNTETICYVSSGLLDGRTSAEITTFIECSDKVILGTHGKKYKSHKYLNTAYLNIDRLIINSTNLFITQEVMEEYKKNGCEVISHPSKVELSN